jgi:hypothetical protein
VHHFFWLAPHDIKELGRSGVSAKSDHRPVDKRKIIALNPPLTATALQNIGHFIRFSQSDFTGAKGFG